MLRYFRLHHLLIVGIITIFCSCLQVFAGDVSLAWDPSPSEGVVGYKIYTGSSSGDYDEPIVIGDQTSYTVTNLTDGFYHYFAVTAFDAAGNESMFSNEVMTLVGGSGKTCDINGDSSVNVVDIQAMVIIILGMNPYSDAFDLNGDGSIDVLDLQILNNVVLGLRSCP